MRAVFFDIGKVLIEFDYGAVARALSTLAGVAVPHLGTLDAPLFDDYHAGSVDDEKLHRFFCERFAHMEFPAFEEAVCSSFAPIDEGLEYLRELQARPDVQVGIISDNHAICTRWMRHHVPAIFDSDAVILSQEVGVLKPHPRMYETALRALNVRPEESFFIDDREVNIEGAKRLGMTGTVHSEWAITRRETEEFLRSCKGDAAQTPPRP